MCKVHHGMVRNNDASLDISSLKPDFQRSTPGVGGVCVIVHFHTRMKLPIPALSSRTFCNDVNVLHLHFLMW